MSHPATGLPPSDATAGHPRVAARLRAADRLPATALDAAFRVDQTLPERYDELIAEAFRSKTEEEHFGYLLEAEQILLEEMPVVPLYWYTRIYLQDPRVRNWNPKLLDNRPYKYIYLSE